MKTILVDLSRHDAIPTALKAAIRMAEQEDARLIGLYIEHLRLAMTGLYSWGSAYTYPVTGKVEANARRVAEATFEEMLSYTGLSHEFRYVEPLDISPLDMLVRQSRTADLIVVGAETGWNDNPNSQADALSQLIEGAGRPVLYVPDQPEAPKPFGSAIVAWDGSREAARAVFDALPILRYCDSVDLVSVNVDPADEEARRTSLARLSDTLDRHGVRATFRVVLGRGSDTKALMKLAQSADLAVMGAYSHSRLRESIFGGVTLGFLKTPPCSVLFSA